VTPCSPVSGYQVSGWPAALIWEVLWRWRQHASPKHRHMSTQVHDVPILGAMTAPHLIRLYGSHIFYISLQETPWEADSCWTNKEIALILWSTTAPYRFHYIPLLVSVFSQMNLLHAPPRPNHRISLTSVLILSYGLCLGLQSGLFPLGVFTKTLYAFVPSHTCHMPCPSHPCLSDHQIAIGEEYRPWVPRVITQFSPVLQTENSRKRVFSIRVS
jgi:hypothetical protein